MALDAARFPRLDKLADGEENIHRLFLSSAGNAPATQTLRLSYFTAEKTEDISRIKVYTGSTAAGATPTYAALGIYSEDPATGDLTLVGQTASDTTLFNAANTGFTRNLTAPFKKRAGTRYATASLVVSSAAMPSFVSVTPQAGAELAIAPKLTGLVAGKTTMPASILGSAVLGSGMFIYAVLLP